MSKQGFIALPLLALIAVLLIGGMAYVYVQKKQVNQPVAATSTAQTSDNSTTLTTGWKTYSNTKFHYSIKYPSDLTIVFEPQSIPVASNQSSSFNLANFKLDFNIFKGLDSGQIMIKGDVYDNSACVGSIDDPNKQEVTVDGVKATKYISRASDGGESTSFYGYSFQKDDNCFVISLRPYPVDKVLLRKFDQILSTFKFTDVTDPIVGIVCGAGIMGGRDSCPTGYICKFPPSHSPGADDGTCVKN